MPIAARPSAISAATTTWSAARSHKRFGGVGPAEGMRYYRRNTPLSGICMSRDFTQHVWNAELEDDCRHLIRLAVREDLDRAYDWTTVSLVPEAARGKAVVAARQPGVIAGVQVAQTVIDEMQLDVTWTKLLDDGANV